MCMCVCVRDTSWTVSKSEDISTESNSSTPMYHYRIYYQIVGSRIGRIIVGYRVGTPGATRVPASARRAIGVMY